MLKKKQMWKNANDISFQNSQMCAGGKSGHNVSGRVLSFSFMKIFTEDWNISVYVVAMSWRFWRCINASRAWYVLAVNRFGVFRTRRMRCRRYRWKSSRFYKNQLFYTVHRSKFTMKISIDIHHNNFLFIHLD